MQGGISTLVLFYESLCRNAQTVGNKYLSAGTLLCYNTTRQSVAKFIGESYSGSIAVSKTVHGGSNPSSPVSNPVKSKGSFIVISYHVNGTHNTKRRFVDSLISTGKST